MTSITDDKILSHYYDNGEVFVVGFDVDKVKPDLSQMLDGTIRFVLKKNEKIKCDYCKRNATRFYNGKNLCELHYLKEYPERNKHLVNWGKLRTMKMSSEDIQFVAEQEAAIK